MQRRRFSAAVGDGDADQDVVGRVLRVLGDDVEVAVVVEDAGVGQLSLRLIFFFSSRRRHTRLTCDWSSDVCSSDLDTFCTLPWQPGQASVVCDLVEQDGAAYAACPRTWLKSIIRRAAERGLRIQAARSEERRVGKECRSRRSRDDCKNNIMSMTHRV